MRLILPLLLAAAAAWGQQKKIYLALDDHTDYMWTADEETYRQAFLEMIDYYVDQAEKTKGSPSEFQSRFHIGGSYWVWLYERNKSPQDFARLLAAIRSGHISLPLNAIDQTFGGTPMEASLRGMYYAGALERKHQLRIPLAIAMENQTLPFGLGALWAGAGAQYSWKGICGCLTKLDKTGRRPHEIYWWKALDGSKILMKWNSMIIADSGARTMGGYAEGRTPDREIEFVTKDPRFTSIYPYPEIGVFGKGWDDLKTTTDEFMVAARKNTTADRKVIVSNMVDFFEEFEKRHGAKLPEYNASFGNEWDLYTASVTEVSARMRRAVEKLRGAEAMVAFLSRKFPEFMQPRREAAERAWMDLGLFWEHNWTSDARDVTREDRNQWGRRLAASFEGYVNSLHADAAYALAGMIDREQSVNRRFYVFNPLGWQRTDAASTSDATLSSITGAIRGKFLENAAYKLRVENRGAISSWIDKTRGNRELAGKLDNGRSTMNDLGQDPGVLEVENAGPVSVTLRARGESPLAHESRITLYRDGRRIDIRNDITENFDSTHHWSFSFNLDQPDMWHEEVGAVVRAKLVADGGHYSPDMSRLDYLTLNHFAAMNAPDGHGVTLSNWDLAFMKLGDSQMLGKKAFLDTRNPSIKVLAGGQIDAPQAGVAKQGGDRHFLQRFALAAHDRYSAVESMRIALEHQNPPVTGWLRTGSAFPAKGDSLLSVSNPSLLLWSLKQAEDGPVRGLVARFWNLSGQPEDYTVSLETGVAKAWTATHTERDLAPLPTAGGKVRVRANQHQIQTLRLEPAR